MVNPILGAVTTDSSTDSSQRSAPISEPYSQNKGRSSSNDHGPIAPDKLDSTNFLSWSKHAKLNITGRGKLGYLTGKKQAPIAADDEEGYDIWVEEDSLVQAWLLNSMHRDVRGNYEILETAKEIWDAVKTTFSVAQDDTRNYELQIASVSTKQNGAPLHNYYSNMKKIWQELDILDPLRLKDAESITYMTNRVTKHRVYFFLAGLDPHLDGVRSRILNTKPLPSIEEAYSQVSAEHNRLQTMMSGKIIEGSAMVTQYRPPHVRGSQFSSSATSWPTPTSGSMKCTHCKSTKHTIDSCFQLKGYPDWWEGHIANLKEAQAKEAKGKEAPGQITTNKTLKHYRPRGNPKASLQVSSPDLALNAASDEPTQGDYSGGPAFAFLTNTGHPNREHHWAGY
ncbi:hypothetical protein M0R45_019783 [Rubus argutus]|uniref:Retrotransposon Copia-like N-terminal domain-containing protein n=1 Tax=Rubus argutus TaxID=59490 RepID=A0AAW1X9Z3_RUBAR